MPDKNQFLAPEYKRLIILKMLGYTAISSVFVANIFMFHNVFLELCNAVLAVLLLAFAAATWRLR